MSVLPHFSARRRAITAGAAAALALALTACGSSGGDHASASGHDRASGAAAPAPGKFDQADIAFAQMMIPHHQQAVSMARLAGGRASDGQVKSLAVDIEKAQGPEIRTMKGWLASWGKPASPSADHSMPGMRHGSGASMPGMMTGEAMSALKAARGHDFDRKFTEMMIGHHRGAITMAQEERRNGSNAAARKLAAAVIEDQRAEVGTMRKILDRL
ncbi:DUF305 domain-containing protein [Streptomyces sp. NBC_00388]|uniref:DUF305 domain-containing protein n=1 Tax=Streptomyces sp. NBC_00388 TaxID=2975735 RepID=UPI002E1ED764